MTAINRRHFLVAASAATQTWAAASDRVRIAIVGVGSRGSAHIKEILPVENVEIAALVEVDGARAEAASQQIFTKTGKRPVNALPATKTASAKIGPASKGRTIDVAA